MEILNIEQELKENSYPGRGIILGKTPDGTKAVAAYFIMGRSENSRNRIFVEDGEGIRTQAFDPSKLVDPSLIIYAPVRVLGNKTIVTNGDQTDTIYEGMDKQLTFEQSLRSREFEPDGPNYTPRISGIMHIENGKYNYAMSILKSSDGSDTPAQQPIHGQRGYGGGQRPDCSAKEPQQEGNVAGRAADDRDTDGLENRPDRQRLFHPPPGTHRAYDGET